MDFVMSLVDRVVVMEFGQKIAEGLPDEIQQNPAVLGGLSGRCGMSGENAMNKRTQGTASNADAKNPVLKVSDLCVSYGRSRRSPTPASPSARARSSP